MSKPKHVATFTFALPVAQDEFGRWLEEHGAELSLSCALGSYRCGVSLCRLISYSDATGRHVETRELSRYHADPTVAISRAVRAAMAIAAGKPVPDDQDLEDRR